MLAGRRGQVGEEQVDRVGGGMRGGQGDIVRNQRREQHKQRQHRLLNTAQHKTGISLELRCWPLCLPILHEGQIKSNPFKL